MAYPLFHPKNDAPHPMIMSEAEFSAAFPTESDYVERKTGIGTEPLQDAIVSFSNTDGGVILIGVNDEGTVVGRELTQGAQDDLHRIMRIVVEPGRYGIEEMSVGSRRVIVLWVAKREEGFAQTSRGRVLVRQGTHKVPLFGRDLRDFINSRTLSRFEATSVSVPLEDASARLVEHVAEAYGWSDESSWEERLTERGLVSPRSLDLTVAGALHLLEDPATVLGKAFIEVLRFPANGGDYDRRVEFRGPLARQVEDCATFLYEELGSELVVLGIRRYELPRIPLVVLREAIANATAHRSYEATGTAIRVELRPEAVIIISPGGLPEPVTIENLRDTQAARNIDTIGVLRRFGLAEDAGRGIDVMEDSMRDEMLAPPIFADSGQSVTVTLPIRSAVAPAERAWVREIEARGLIELSDRVVLVHAARGEKLTNSRVRDLLGVDQVTARMSLHRLRDAGFLVQNGRRGGASYALEESIAPPAGLRLPREDLKELIVSLAEDEPVTNARVRIRTGLGRAQALAVLDEVVAEGRLVRVGERRGTRYVRPESPA
jgi:ATP-dependent DNA helicase RecG